MRRTLVFATAAVLLSAASARAQVGTPLPASPGQPQFYESGPQTMVPVGTPGIEYAGTIAAGEGAQMYPYDQQDPWLHGHFQRYPAYGGFASFRPYNYRHVFSQTQLAPRLGASYAMPYSQQFWNRYRTPYLNGHLHSLPPAPAGSPQPGFPAQGLPVIPNGQTMPMVTPTGVMRPIGYQTQWLSTAQSPTLTDSRPIHVFPEQ